MRGKWTVKKTQFVRLSPCLSPLSTKRSNEPRIQRDCEPCMWNDTSNNNKEIVRSDLIVFRNRIPLSNSKESENSADRFKVCLDFCCCCLYLSHFHSILRVRVRCGSLWLTMVSRQKKRKCITNGNTIDDDDDNKSKRRTKLHCCMIQQTNGTAIEQRNSQQAAHESYRNCFKSESVWGNALKRALPPPTTHQKIKFIILLLGAAACCCCSTFIFIQFDSIHSLAFHFPREHIESANWAHFT